MNEFTFFFFFPKAVSLVIFVFFFFFFLAKAIYCSLIVNYEELIFEIINLNIGPFIIQERRGSFIHSTDGRSNGR